MITDFILGIPLWIINGALSILPNSTGLPTEVTSAITSAISYVNGVSYFFPIGTLMTTSILMFAVHKAELIWHGINWLIKKIPGVS